MTARGKRFSVCVMSLMLGAILASPDAFSELDIVLDVRPGAILFGGGGDFKAIGQSEETVRGQRVTETEKLGGISTFPNLKLGVSLDSPTSILDIMGGGGILVNDPFRSFFLGVDASWQYKFRKNVALGPHAGLLYFTDPEWAGDGEVEFSDSWGAIAGMEMTFGYDVLFVFSIDYFYINPFDATPGGNWDISDKELDLSGFALQFGMRGRF